MTAASEPSPEAAPGISARARLIELRAKLIAGLDRGIEAGHLALLSSVQSCIAAIDEAAASD